MKKIELGHNSVDAGNRECCFHHCCVWWYGLEPDLIVEACETKIIEIFENTTHPVPHQNTSSRVYHPHSSPASHSVTRIFLAFIHTKRTSYLHKNPTSTSYHKRMGSKFNYASFPPKKLLGLSKLLKGLIPRSAHMLGQQSAQSPMFSSR